MINPGSKYEDNLRRAIIKEMEDTLLTTISSPEEFYEACGRYLELKEFEINPVPKKFKDNLCACYVCGDRVDLPHVIQLEDSSDVIEQLPFHPECVVKKVLKYYTGNRFFNDFMISGSKKD